MEYWQESSEQTHRSYWETAKLNYFDDTLRSLARLAPSTRLLDIGGGIGIFADRALRAGWDAYSLDVSPIATELAADRIGPQRALSSLATEQVRSFDVVSLWCVVAHTDDPGAVIDSCRHAMRPNGVLWLTTPNFSFQKPYGWLRGHLGNPLDFARDDHVGHFTPKAISVLLERRGFTDVSFRFWGIVETCIAVESTRPALIVAKRAWNRAGLLGQRCGLPNMMSELQVTARLSTRSAAGP